MRKKKSTRDKSFVCQEITVPEYLKSPDRTIFAPMKTLIQSEWENAFVQENKYPRGHPSNLPLSSYITMVAKSGIAVGINKGHITARRELKAKPSNKIGVRMNGCTGYWKIKRNTVQVEQRRIEMLMEQSTTNLMEKDRDRNKENASLFFNIHTHKREIDQLTFSYYRLLLSVPLLSSPLFVKLLVTLHMNVVLWNWSRTPRISVPRSFVSLR